MCNLFFLSFRGCLIFGMRRGRPGAIPPPIPPPPWAKCRPAQGLGLHFRPGGRGNGRGNSTRKLNLEFAQDHASSPLFCVVLLGCARCSAVMPPLAYYFLIATVPNMDSHISPQYQKCHPQYTLQYQKLLPTVHPHYHPCTKHATHSTHPQYQKTASHSTPTLPPLYQKCHPQYTPSVPKTASHSTPTRPPPVPKMQPPCTKTASLKFFFWPPFFVCPLKVNYVQFVFSQFSRMSHFWYAKG